LAKRFPDVTERHLVQIFWDGADQYIRVKWLDRGMSPEESSLDELVKIGNAIREIEGGTG
jgi:hypothetical protein